MRPSPPLAPCRLVGLALFLLAGLAKAPVATAHDGHDARIQALNDSLAIDPDRSDLLLRRGDLLRNHGQARAALADYERAGGHGAPPLAVALGRAAAHLDLAEPDAALACLETIDALYDAVWFLRGRAHALREEWRRAADAYERALLATDRPTPDRYLELSEWTLAGGDEEQALAVLQEGSTRLGNPVALVLRAAELEVELGRHEDALRRLASLEPSFAARELLLARRGDVLTRAGRDLEARAVYTEALELLESRPPSRRTPSLKALHLRLLAALSIPSAREGPSP